LVLTSVRGERRGAPAHTFKDRRSRKIRKSRALTQGSPEKGREGKREEPSRSSSGNKKKKRCTTARGRERGGKRKDSRHFSLTSIAARKNQKPRSFPFLSKKGEGERGGGTAANFAPERAGTISSRGKEKKKRKREEKLRTCSPLLVQQR